MKYSPSNLNRCIMEEFVAYLVKNLVSNPDEVKVSLREEEGRIEIDIRVAHEDIGKVIGRGGNTVNALRTITRVIAARLGKRVHLELLQEEEESCLKQTNSA